MACESDSPTLRSRRDALLLGPALAAGAALGSFLPGTAKAANYRGPALHPASEPELLRGNLPTPPFAVRVLSKMGFGPRPGDVAAFNALGGNDTARLTAYVDQQLNPQAINDTEVTSRLTVANGYTTLNRSLTELWAHHVVANGDNYNVRMRPIAELERAAFVRAVHSKRQLAEVLADFWHNHFNIFGFHFSAGPLFVHYDRDVIRTHMLGNFRTFLESVAMSTSMLYYLDNRSSTNAGPNENFARELLELHTLGAENYLGVLSPFEVPRDDEDIPIGYVDVDVYEATRAFTGWTVKNGHWQYPGENDGSFVYRAAWHDRFNKFFLGTYLPPDQPALRDGRQVLDALASHPGTARHVCRKLARRLIGDQPSDALVNSAATLFRSQWQAPDQLRQVTRHILLSSDFVNSWGNKTRRPFETVVAALRAGDSSFTLRPDHGSSNDFMWRFQATGNKPYGWAPPNGYPDVATAWQGSNALGMSWRMLAWLVEHRDGSSGPWVMIDVHAQTVLMIPTASQRTARRLVQVWTERLLGQQASGPLAQQLEEFMAQNADPDDVLDISSDSWSGSNLRNHHIRSRLRTMVAMVMATPDFLQR